MIATACRTFQHHQTNLILLGKNGFHQLLGLLFIIAVHIVKEETANALASCQWPVYITEVISQLKQLTLRLAIPFMEFLQEIKIFLRVPQSHQRVSVFHRMGKFDPVLALPFIRYSIDHRLYPFSIRYFAAFGASFFKILANSARWPDGITIT